MAHVQVELFEASTRHETITDDVLTASRENGGIIIISSEKLLVRIALNKKEAAAIAAKLAPHIP